MFLILITGRFSPTRVKIYYLNIWNEHQISILIWHQKNCENLVFSILLLLVYKFLLVGRKIKWRSHYKTLQKEVEKGVRLQYWQILLKKEKKEVKKLNKGKIAIANKENENFAVKDSTWFIFFVSLPSRFYILGYW